MEVLRSHKSEVISQKDKMPGISRYRYIMIIFKAVRDCCAIRYLTISLFLLFSSHLFAQSDSKSFLVAFENSYSMEAKADYSRAIKTLKDVYQENSYEINLRLGWLHYLSGLYMESTSFYQKAMKLKPYAIEPKFGLVLPSSALGNWTQVISEYQEILKIDPQNTIANYRMGSIYYGKQDYIKAEKYLEKVVNLYPFDYDANLLYGWTNLKLGKLREAKVMFNKVLLNKPKDTSALEGLSLIK
jgi:tetratricopeptide (TPR) repeat protein